MQGPRQWTRSSGRFLSNVAEIQSVRFAQFYRRLASLKEAYTPDLQETFFPTIELTNPFSTDLARLRGEDLVAIGPVLVPAVAGQFPQLWIVPAAGVIFVPLWFNIQNVTPAALINVGWAPAIANPFALTQRFIRTDNRAHRSPPTASAIDAIAGSTQWASGNSAALSASLQNFLMLSNGLNVPPLFGTTASRTDTALVLSTGVANTAFTVAIIGYERHIELQENV